MVSLNLEVAKIIFVCQTKNSMLSLKQIPKSNLVYPESFRERGTAWVFKIEDKMK